MKNAFDGFDRFRLALFKNYC